MSRADIDEPRIVAFLDLLGFRQYLLEDTDAAQGLLEDYSGAIRAAYGDAGFSYPDPQMQNAADRTLVTSFEEFLPMSDSIFIVARDANSFVLQLSHFLMACFEFKGNAFTFPERKDDPRRVTIHTIAPTRIAAEEELWLPVFFRGGIAFGEVRVFNRMSQIAGGALVDGRNLIGKAVAEATQLEERLKGPRILCSPTFQAQLTGNAAAYVQRAMDMVGFNELYWPLAYFENLTSIEDGINNGLRQPLLAALNLWNHFANSPQEPHYMAFARLLVRSALLKWPDDVKEIQHLLRQTADDSALVEFLLCG